MAAITAPDRPKLAIAGAILWIGIGSAITFLDSDAGRQTIVLSWMAILFSAWVFLRHGGRYITAAGVWSICVGLFGGFSGLYWQGVQPNDPVMANAVGAVFLTHAAMYYLFWAGRSAHQPEAGPVSVEAMRGFVTLGLLMTALGTGLSVAGIAGSLAAPMAFTGVVLASVGLLTGSGRRRGFIALVFVGLLAAVYVQFVFSGFGRLILAALAFSLVIVFLTRWRTWWAKILTLVAIPPALIYLIEQREQFGLETTGQILDGIGSVVEPLRQFSVMLATPDHFELAWGSTFWAALVTHVPGEWWAGKPEGFALESAWIYAPTLAAVGGTLATLLHGELVYNFGPWGLLAMVPLVGLAVRWLDLGLLRSIARGISSRRDGLVMTALIIAVGGMTDLFWSGTHTFMGRTGTRLLILLVLILLWTWSEKLRSPLVNHRGARFYTTQAPPGPAGETPQKPAGVLRSIPARDRPRK